MKRFSLFVLLLTFALFSTRIYAYDSLASNTSRQDDYTYENTDCNQKKVAAGMYLWGFLFFCGIVVVSLVIPNNPSPASTAPKGNDSSGNFSTGGSGSAYSTIAGSD